MTTAILDLAASTRDALSLRQAVGQRAVEAFRTNLGVGHDFLDAMLQEHPQALLWSPVIWHPTWWNEHGRHLTETEIAEGLALEATLRRSFNFSETARVFAHFRWDVLNNYPAATVVNAQDHINGALDLIARIWPEGYANVRAIAHGICWFESEQFANYSDIRYFGSIFLRPQTLDHSIMELAILIIHEVAHHVLFGELRTDPLITEDKARTVYSPLRKTQRPIGGVTQSMAALVRMIIWLHQVLDYEGELAPELRAEAEIKCEGYQNDLIQVIEPMRDVQYSEQGARIFADFALVRDHL